jgi:hypothetical protein
LRRASMHLAERIHFENLEPEPETYPFSATDHVVLNPSRSALNPIPERLPTAHQAEFIISNQLDCSCIVSHVAPLPR